MVHGCCGGTEGGEVWLAREYLLMSILLLKSFLFPSGELHAFKY